MFTGIVVETGRVAGVAEGDCLRSIRIDASVALEGLAVGDSVAVDGVCLTAVEVTQDGFTVEVMQESLDRSTLGDLGAGMRVNLERPMAADGRFDGHIVQGHVDGVAKLRSRAEEGAAVRLWFEIDPRLLRYLVEKGSITLDGVSLTVTAVDGSGFEVSLIPHTLEVTGLGDRHVGDGVNVEVDVLAKYVERLMEAR